MACDVIYTKGKAPEKGEKVVAIIGARFCSEYGRYTAHWYGDKLARMGYSVLSDGGLGASGIALRAAQAAGGKTYVAMIGGTDVIYPPENSDIIEAATGRLSFMPDGAMVESKHASARTTLLVSLADAVVVIEARKKTGTLIATKIAQEMGKKLFALPGRVTDRLSDGTNDLIKHGKAQITLDPFDIDV